MHVRSVVRAMHVSCGSDSLCAKIQPTKPHRSFHVCAGNHKGQCVRSPKPSARTIAAAERQEKFGKDSPMKRPGQPSQVAPAYVYLACEDSSYATGQFIHINGGGFIG